MGEITGPHCRESVSRLVLDRETFLLPSGSTSDRRSSAALGAAVFTWIFRQLGPTRMHKIENLNPVHACESFNPFYRASAASDDEAHNADSKSGSLSSPVTSPFSDVDQDLHLQLVDGGMSNNLPLSVFLHVSPYGRWRRLLLRSCSLLWPG